MYLQYISSGTELAVITAGMSSNKSGRMEPDIVSEIMIMTMRKSVSTAYYRVGHEPGSFTAHG